MSNFEEIKTAVCELEDFCIGKTRRRSRFPYDRFALKSYEEAGGPVVEVFINPYMARLHVSDPPAIDALRKLAARFRRGGIDARFNAGDPYLLLVLIPDDPASVGAVKQILQQAKEDRVTKEILRAYKNVEKRITKISTPEEGTTALNRGVARAMTRIKFPAKKFH
jgi:hypothetical protein